MSTLIDDPIDIETPETIVPNRDEEIEAKRAFDALVDAKSTRQRRVRQQGKRARTITIPDSAFRLLTKVLYAMSQGRAFTFVPRHAEFSTQMAADFLNVSRPFLIKLLEQGMIPYRSVGKHRRIRFVDLVEYKNRDDDARRKIREELTEEAQELDMGY